jgi:ATP-dependent DNA helicase RecG
MDLAELEHLLSELRVVRHDHQTVEAKRAPHDLPASIWDTLSAFANSIGCVLLLGVDEANKSFTVTGVEDPGAVSNALRGACAELEPPLRPVIETIVHENGPVVVATVNSLPRYQRPCYRRSGGPTASFIRVGDGDQKLTQAEVDEMQAERSNVDFSRRPAADVPTLDPDAVDAFLRAYRIRNPRLRDFDDEELLLRAGVVLDGGTPTLAALLVLGSHPQAFEPAASIAIRVDPSSEAPAGSRMRSTHVQGTIGELLDDAFYAVIGELNTFQVERAGAERTELIPTKPVIGIARKRDERFTHLRCTRSCHCFAIAGCSPTAHCFKPIASCEVDDE